MPVTTTLVDTVHAELDSANPNTVFDALRKMGLGSMLAPLRVTFAALASAASQDITTAAARAAATINVGALRVSKTVLPPALAVISCRVIAGTALAGPRTVSDTGATVTAPAGANGLPGVAKISDDGKTLTFDAAVTGFTITYIPRPDVDMESVFAPST